MARSLGWLVALALVACLGPRTAAADFPDDVPVPPRIRPESADRAVSRNAEKSRRPAALDRSGTAPSATGQDLSPGESQLPAPPEPSTSLRPTSRTLPDRQRPIPLAPQSSEARTGVSSGDVPPLVTAAASLGIVLGLFLLVVWVVRRGMPKNVALLPREAVEVLGRAPLVGRQQIHLVRCGNKILLLSVSPGNVETLSEITDPIEVDRLAGICQQINPNSASTTFRTVFQQFGKQPREMHFPARRSVESLDFDSLEITGHSRTQESHA